MLLFPGAKNSPGFRLKTTVAILAVVLSYNTCRGFHLLRSDSSPGYCTCRGTLIWRAVKAKEWSYGPGKLIFAGVINLLANF